MARARLTYLARYRNGRRLTFFSPGDAAALRYAKGLGSYRVGRSKPVSLRRVSAAAAPKKRNPVDVADVEKGARAYEEFTGRAANVVQRHKAPSGGAGWELGKATSISYIATRDGERAEYTHRFKRRSRPQLASSFDGSQLYLLGGAYSVTDLGIVDDA